MYLLHVTLLQGQITQRVRRFTFALCSTDERTQAEDYWRQCESATFFVEAIPEYLPTESNISCHVANQPH